jgi:hypothetical protein
MLVKDCEHLLRYPTPQEAQYATITFTQELQYTWMQIIHSHILKRSLKKRTIFFAIKLEELELSWNAVRYLLRVLFQQTPRRILIFLWLGNEYIKWSSSLKPEQYLNLSLALSNFCLVDCGQITYPQNK